MIEANNLHKRFKLYEKPSDRLREIIFRRPYHHLHHALSGVSFSVASGETLGILGKNGAGKSTLLKILTGVLLPDDGDIKISGKITGLLELGTGFDMELNGLKNIVTNGLLLGMLPGEIIDKQESIVAFSELGDFIHEPLRTYSSGMVMRLAFAIAIHADPQCFVVDEALSVGDAHFQQKCMRRIRHFRDRGGSIIFVSHDLNAVKMLCDRAIVLDQGNVAAEGSPEEAVNHYNRIIADLEDRSLTMEENEKETFGSRQAEIISSRLVGSRSHSNIVSSGETARITLVIRANENLDHITVGMLIRDRFGQDIFGINSHHLDDSLFLSAGQQATVHFEIQMDLAPGKYTISVALHSEENHIENCYHWCDKALRFEIAGIADSIFAGVCRLHSKLTIEAPNGQSVIEKIG